MGRQARVPTELRDRPFTLEEARSAGLDRWHLEGAGWRRLGPKVYARAGEAESPLTRLAAALLRLPQSAVFSGLTAAWLHGLDVDPCDPIEVILPPNARVAGRSGMRVRRASLSKREVTVARRMSATSIERTLADTSAFLSATEAVVLVDSALRCKLTNLKRLRADAAARSGRAGVNALRRVIDLAEPASESPMESRLRALLVLAGLPRPVAQYELCDASGHFVARVDLFYPQQRLALEYDGAVHKNSLVDDNRRQNRLLAEDIRLLRFTGADVLGNPGSVIDQVRRMLARAA